MQGRSDRCGPNSPVGRYGGKAHLLLLVLRPLHLDWLGWLAIALGYFAVSWQIASDGRWTGTATTGIQRALWYRQDLL